MRILIAAMMSVLLTEPVVASTPSAWAELKRRAERTCTSASRLASPRVSNPVIFDDRSGQVALLVTGSLRGRNSGPTSITKLCLFDRMNGKAALEEAIGWRGPRSPGGR